MRSAVLTYEEKPCRSNGVNMNIHSSRKTRTVKGLQCCDPRAGNNNVVPVVTKSLSEQGQTNNALHLCKRQTRDRALLGLNFSNRHFGGHKTNLSIQEGGPNIYGPHLFCCCTEFGTGVLYYSTPYLSFLMSFKSKNRELSFKVCRFARTELASFR